MMAAFRGPRSNFVVRLVMYRNGVSIQHAEEINLSEMGNTSTANAWRNMLFGDTIKGLVN